jgi:hypothetical protein
VEKLDIGTRDLDIDVDDLDIDVSSLVIDVSYTDIQVAGAAGHDEIPHSDEHRILRWVLRIDDVASARNRRWCAAARRPPWRWWSVGTGIVLVGLGRSRLLITNPRFGLDSLP